MNKQLLKDALQKAWCAETALGNWTPDCPSLNQCAVTSLIVQDYFGGVLLRCKMTDGDSHYWNGFEDGHEEDWTEAQFDFITDKPIKSDFVIRDRDYVLSFPNTKLRYELLKQRVEKFLAE